MKATKKQSVEKEISVGKFSTISKQVVFNYVTIITQILLAPLLVALLTRTLSVSEYGVYSLLMVFVFFSISFLELGLSQYIITKVSGLEHSEKVRTFFSILRFEALFLATALLIFIVSPLGNYFLRINKLSAYGSILKVCVAIVFIATLLRLFNSYFKAIKHINYANFLDMLFNKGLAVFLLLFFLLYRKFVLINVFQIWLLVAVIALGIALYLSRKELRDYVKIGERAHYAKKALVFSIPLILVIISSWFLALSNRYILNYYTTTAVVGVFAVAYSLMSVITTFSTTVAQVIQPYFTEAFMKKEKHEGLINTSLKYGLILVIPAIVAAVVWRREIILLISGTKYLGATPIMVTLALYPIFTLIAFVFYQVLIAAERNTYVGLMHLIAAGLSVGLNILLIPVWGMQGAAVATLLSYGFLAVAMAIPGLRYVGIYPEFLKLPKILFAAALMGGVLFFAKPDELILEFSVLAFAAVLYFTLIIVLRVLDRKEIEIIKKLAPAPFHPLLDYFVK